MSSSITRLGCLFFEWQPIRHLDPTALKVWLVIYTQCDIPGLWKCDLPDIASKAFLSPEVTLRALDKLRDADLIEFDRTQRVLRLTQLPDAAEWPNSPNILSSWWSIFQRRIPACDVRDAHVATMRWLLEEGAKQVPRSKTRKPSEAHEEIWSETFGTVKIPPRRARGQRRFSDSDTSTPEQPSLFRDPIPDPILEASVTDVRGPDATPVEVVENVSVGSHTGSHPKILSKRRDTETETDHGSASDSGSPDPEPPGVPTCGTVSSPPPDETTRPLRLVPLPVDERSRLQSEIIRAIGYAHAMAFQRVKKQVGSTAFGPSVVDDHAELRQLVDAMPSLEGVRERLEYALAIREQQAVHENSVKYFGASMWRRGNYDKALALELKDVDGTRAAPGAKRSAFEVMDEAFDRIIAAEEKLS